MISIKLRNRDSAPGTVTIRIFNLYLIDSLHPPRLADLLRNDISSHAIGANHVGRSGPSPAARLVTPASVRSRGLALHTLDPPGRSVIA